jgi:hypothetical protein
VDVARGTLGATRSRSSRRSPMSSSPATAIAASQPDVATISSVGRARAKKSRLNGNASTSA